MREMKRVLLISNVPQTYRIPLFNEIDTQLRAKGIELKVVFASDGYKRRKSQIDFSEIKFQYEILKSVKFNFGNVEKTMFTYGGILDVISDFKPDKIIVLGFSLATIKIYFRSFTKKTEYVIWSGAVELAGQQYSFLRQFIRRMLVKRAAAFVSYGTKAKEYLIKLGAPAAKVHVGINTVDTKFFSGETNRIRTTKVGGATRHLLYIGYLVPRKNVGKLIDIIGELSRMRKDFVLDILGDGYEKPMLEKRVQEKNLVDVIRFHGFIQRNGLPEYFAQSTCFLFQTDFDVWGLVLNEAMAAGLPVLSSLNAAATYDLIVDGETGFAVDFNNGRDVLEKLNALLDNPERVLQIGKNAQRLMEMRASIRISAEGFVHSVTGD
jgi:glycosyltransferase involved in cell wall biosynthesis